MRGFSRRHSVAEALAWLDAQLQPLPPECVPLSSAAGRVLAAEVRSTVNVPGFTRSMMDGFALLARDTIGASDTHRKPLEIIGEALPGRAFAGECEPGQAVRIMTGAPLPAGADAVLPIEKTNVEGTRLWACEELQPQKHVGRIGEDIAKGALVLPAGRRLRPQDLGVLSSIGVGEVAVVRSPRVRIVVTGSELLPAGSMPHDYCIADANGPLLAALVERDGGLANHPGIVPDDREAIAAALHEEADVLLVSGGSSVGQEDHAPTLLARDGLLAIHGIAMRPSSPTGLGKLGSRLVFLLPGNPVACLCAYDFFAGRAIRALGGRDREWPYARVRRTLTQSIVSQVGRLDYARVMIHEEHVEPLAIAGGSSLSSTTRADGFVVIPAEISGYAAETEVDVWLY